MTIIAKKNVLRAPQPLQIGLVTKDQDTSPAAALFIQTALTWTQSQAVPLAAAN
ncbi:MAG: hypothetical protein H0X30_19010 [Anaerolineae bacterium]|nr:hypothetical protein [Anaerolineae bacterium]